MPSQTKYTDNTPADNIIDVFKRLHACAESVPWFEKYLGKSFDALCDGFKDPEYDPAWGIWLLKVFGLEVDLKQRLKAIEEIKDPMQALDVYISLEWLTDEEDKLLESKFKGKLPRAERELKDGVVKRLKNGGN
jgi:hypothetical protein